MNEDERSIFDEQTDRMHSRKWEKIVSNQSCPKLEHLGRDSVGGVKSTGCITCLYLSSHLVL